MPQCTASSRTVYISKALSINNPQKTVGAID